MGAEGKRCALPHAAGGRDPSSGGARGMGQGEGWWGGWVVGKFGLADGRGVGEDAKRRPFEDGRARTLTNKRENSGDWFVGEPDGKEWTNMKSSAFSGCNGLARLPELQEATHVHSLPLRQAEHEARPRPRGRRYHLAPALLSSPVPLKPPKHGAYRQNSFQLIRCSHQQ